MKRLFLVDAYALIYKYYYAYLSRPMLNGVGMNTSVVFGFIKFLRSILHREQPDLLGVAFDPKGGCFRRNIFPEYKANRPATPEDIIRSVPYIKRYLEAMHIPILEVAGFEADDVIGTLSQKACNDGYEVFMVTPDKDYGQLVRPHCKLYKQKGDDIEIVDCEAIRKHYGFDDPILVRDMLALWGDASDNIPGVPGIGEKGACKLVQTWGTVENILDNVHAIKGRQGENIATSADRLRMAKVLTTIRLDVPISFNPSELELCSPDNEKLRALYTELNFNLFLRELPPSSSSTQESCAPQPSTTSSISKGTTPAIISTLSADGQGDLFAALNTEQISDITAPAIETKVASTAEPTLFDNLPQLSDLQHTVHTYHIVTSDKLFEQMFSKLSTATALSFSTVTTTMSALNDSILGIALCVAPHEAWYIPYNQPGTARYFSLLQPLFVNEHIAKIGQNLKFDIQVLHRLGILLAGPKYDTMILHYLLDPESRHNLNTLACNYLHYTPIEIDSLVGRIARHQSFDILTTEQIADYAAERADLILQLKGILYSQLETMGMHSLYHNIEEPLIAVLADMETTGVQIDKQALADYAIELNGHLSELETAIRNEANDDTLNVNSAKQLGEVLFVKMKIADKPKLTRTHQYCTDEEYLLSFSHKHRIIDLILEYRGIKKLLSTYVEALPLLINRRTGHIHTSYNQAVTATGRLSSTNPNLQNIPIRDELGKRIRRAFISSSSDRVLLSADYSQVELRLMAHLSGDQALITAFEQGEDVHAATAAHIFNKPIEQVTADERRKAKTANFGIIYGISAFGLSQRLDIARGEAKELIDGYFSSYPGVKKYMEQAIAQAREKGYVTTLFGRRRYLNDINSRNAVSRGLSERNAINAPIQGSAADIMKLAMIRIADRFREEGIQSKMILQVHDEVVIDTLCSELEQVRNIVRQAMEEVVTLKVPLIAECGVGSNWLDAH